MTGLLLDRSADPNVQDKNGYSALAMVGWTASQTDCAPHLERLAAVTRLLLSAGALIDESTLGMPKQLQQVC